MFSWNKLEWDIEGEHIVIKIDETAYNILLQRYKELFDGVDGGGGGVDIPYAIDTYLTEIAVGKYNDEYMNSKFTKYIKAIQANDLSSEVVKNTLDELHQSFASLSQENQKFADMFLGDLQRGDVTLVEGKTIQDYISEYKKRVKDSQIHSFAVAFGINEDDLASLMNLTSSVDDINQYGRFDKLKDTVDRVKAKKYIEEQTGEKVLGRKLAVKIDEVLRRFILKGETFVGEDAIIVTMQTPADSNADDKVVALIENMMDASVGSSILKVIVECQKEFGESYPTRSQKEWYHLVRDYVEKRNKRYDIPDDEVIYFMAAEPDPE